MKEHPQPSKDLLPMVEATFDQDGVQATSEIGPDGREYPDPVPMAVPVGYTAPPTIMEMIKTMIHSERLREVADAQGFDTFEEAEDFDVLDDPVDPHTDYEAVFDPPPVPLPDPTPTNTVKAAAEGGSQTPPPTSASQPQKLLDTSSLGETSPSNPAKPENPGPRGP
ncbi:hypothetical protein [robinz microvirus RP_39]|nr:hypothetical protein [robinz microvirus RP_39]